MAVRFDADGESYTRSISLGSITQFSVACWIKISVDRDVASTFWSLDADATVTRLALMTAADGTTLQLAEGFNYRTLTTLTVGSWYFVGIAFNGADSASVIRTPTTSATVTTWSDGARTSVNANNWRIGHSGFPNQWLNGCVTAVKVWIGTTLTTAELEAESWTYTPKRTANLAGWFPLLTPSTVDYSGNGWTLSGGSGTTAEVGPPLQWRPGRRRIVVPAAALPPIDAEFDATLPPVAASAAGVVSAAGSLDASLPALDAEITAHLGNNTQLDAALPALTASLTGQLDITGQLDATLPALTADISGEAEANVIEVVLPPLAASLTGHVSATAALDAQLPALTVALEGKTIPPHGDVTITTPGPVRGWHAATPARAWATPAAAVRGWRARPPAT